MRAEAERADKQNKLITLHEPGFDFQKIPLPFNTRQTDAVTDRAKIFAALANMGLVPSGESEAARARAAAKAAAKAKARAEREEQARGTEAERKRKEAGAAAEAERKRRETEEAERKPQEQAVRAVTSQPVIMRIGPKGQDREMTLKPGDSFRDLDIGPEMVVAPSGGNSLPSNGLEEDAPLGNELDKDFFAKDERNKTRFYKLLSVLVGLLSMVPAEIILYLPIIYLIAIYHIISTYSLEQLTAHVIISSILTAFLLLSICLVVELYNSGDLYLPINYEKSILAALIIVIGSLFIHNSVVLFYGNHLKSGLSNILELITVITCGLLWCRWLFLGESIVYKMKLVFDDYDYNDIILFGVAIVIFSVVSGMVFYLFLIDYNATQRFAGGFYFGLFLALFTLGGVVAILFAGISLYAFFGIDHEEDLLRFSPLAAVFGIPAFGFHFVFKYNQIEALGLSDDFSGSVVGAMMPLVCFPLIFLVVRHFQNPSG